MLLVVPRRERMRKAPTLLAPRMQLERDPLATIAISAAPVVLEGRYRVLMRALWQPPAATVGSRMSPSVRLGRQ